MGITLAAGYNWYYALDSVYDFATMQHDYFITDGNGYMGQVFATGGSGESDTVLGITYSEYGGLIWGFKTSPISNVVSDYSGLAGMWNVGLSGGVGIFGDTVVIGIGIGVTNVSSFADPKIQAWLAYRSIGVGVDIVPWLDGGRGSISMSQFNLNRRTFGTDYLLNGKLNEIGLYGDILTGQKSVWLSDRWPNTPGNPLNFTMNQYKADSGKMRAIGLVTAMHYAMVYKELHWGFPEFEFPYRLGEVY
jgi:hypothetical protein